MPAIVHLDDAADHILTSAERALPVLVAQDERRFAVVAVVFGPERAPEQGRDAECLEEVPRHDTGGHALGFDAPEEDEVHVVVLDHGVERGRAAADVVEVEDREAGVVDVGARLPQEQEILAARIRQRLQHDGVDDAENGSVGADAERHGDGDGKGIAGLFAQATEAVADVLREGFEQPGQPGVAHVVLDAVETAEELARVAARDFRPETLASVLGRLHVEVELQLGIELALHRAATKDRANALQPGWHGGADDAQCKLMTGRSGGSA